jgi:lysophospholipase L1-like esterase
MAQGHHRNDGSRLNTVTVTSAKIQVLRQCAVLLSVCAATAAGCGSHKTVVQPTPVPDPPVLSCPADIALVSHNGQAPPTASFDLPAAEKGQVPVSVTCTPSPGSELPGGTTTVLCEAIDSLQRKGTCSFSIVVTPVPQLAKTFFLAFGDSLTEGKPPSLRSQGAVVVPTRIPPVLDYADGYVDQLDSKLAGRYQDQTIAIIAEGFGGEETGIGKTRLVDELRQFNPEILLLLEGVNDMLNHPDQDGINSAADALQKMVRDSNARGVTVFLATLPPMVPGGKTSPAILAAAPRLNDRIRVIASQQNVTLVDLAVALPATAIGSDGVHMTREGYGLMAEEWLKAIIAKLEIKTSTPQ